MKKNIKLFTTPQCGACRSIKIWLGDWCKINNIQFQIVDCITSPNLANKFDIQTVPTVVVNNATRLIIPKITMQRIIEALDKPE